MVKSNVCELIQKKGERKFLRRYLDPVLIELAERKKVGAETTGQTLRRLLTPEIKKEGLA